MKQLGEYQLPFPDSPKDEWHPIVRNRVLAMYVLAVAQTRIEGAWAAYIDAVPGQNLNQETQEVLDIGNKLPENIAKVLFPYFDGIPYAH